MIDFFCQTLFSALSKSMNRFLTYYFHVHSITGKPAEMQPHSYEDANYLSYMLTIIGVIGKVRQQKVTLKYTSSCYTMQNIC